MNRNYYLYLDTSEEKALILLFDKDEKIVSKINWEAGRELSRTLSVRYGELLAAAAVSKEELGGVVVFAGPGSFTGLRIGISFANALAFGLGVPVYESREKGIFKLAGDPEEFATPFYGAEPKITKPKKFCD